MNAIVLVLKLWLLLFFLGAGEGNFMIVLHNMTCHLPLCICMHSTNANLSGTILLWYRITADLLLYCVN